MKKITQSKIVFVAMILLAFGQNVLASKVLSQEEIEEKYNRQGFSYWGNIYSDPFDTIVKPPVVLTQEKIQKDKVEIVVTHQTKAKNKKLYNSCYAGCFTEGERPLGEMSTVNTFYVTHGGCRQLTGRLNIFGKEYNSGPNLEIWLYLSKLSNQKYNPDKDYRAKAIINGYGVGLQACQILANKMRTQEPVNLITQAYGESFGRPSLAVLGIETEEFYSNGSPRLTGGDCYDDVHILDIIKQQQLNNMSAWDHSLSRTGLIQTVQCSGRH